MLHTYYIGVVVTLLLHFFGQKNRAGSSLLPPAFFLFRFQNSSCNCQSGVSETALEPVVVGPFIVLRPPR